MLNKRNINHLKPLARRILEEARKDNNLAKLLAVSFGIEAHASSKIKQSIRNEPSKWLSLASLHGYYGGPFPVFHPMFLNDVKDVLATDVLFDGAITLGMALPEDLNLMPPCKPILGEFRWSSKAELIESINHGWWFPFTCSKDFAKYLAEGDNATKAYPNILERLAPDISMAVQLNDYIKQQACSTLMYGNKRRPFSEAQNSLDFSR